MLDNAFEALKKYDWGTDLAALAPIEDAVTASHGDANARRDLENRLLAALKGNISRDAHDYVCRKLAIVGTVTAVPTLAGLLGQQDHSHMARFALERINAPEAGQALRDALAQVSGILKIGVISSLGARRDAEAVAPLGGLLKDNDPAVARAAALSLGAIGNAESATLLQANLQAGKRQPTGRDRRPAGVLPTRCWRATKRPTRCRSSSRCRRPARTTRTFGRHARLLACGAKSS